VVEGGSQSVEVGAGVGGAVAILLRRAVARGEGSRPDGRAAALLEQFADAEVDQNGATVVGDANVGRLDVAVDDGRRLVVQIGQRVTHLPCPAHCLFLRQDALPVEH